jgi:hypothetical protein
MKYCQAQRNVSRASYLKYTSVFARDGLVRVTNSVSVPSRATWEALPFGKKTSTAMEGSRPDHARAGLNPDGAGNQGSNDHGGQKENRNGSCAAPVAA